MKSINVQKVKYNNIAHEHTMLSSATYPGASSYGGVRTWLEAAQYARLTNIIQIISLLNKEIAN